MKINFIYLPNTCLFVSVIYHIFISQTRRTYEFCSFLDRMGILAHLVTLYLNFFYFGFENANIRLNKIDFIRNFNCWKINSQLLRYIYSSIIIFVCIAVIVLFNKITDRVLQTLTLYSLAVFSARPSYDWYISIKEVHGILIARYWAKRFLLESIGSGALGMVLLTYC